MSKKWSNVYNEGSVRYIKKYLKIPTGLINSDLSIRQWLIIFLLMFFNSCNHSNSTPPPPTHTIHLQFITLKSWVTNFGLFVILFNYFMVFHMLPKHHLHKQSSIHLRFFHTKAFQRPPPFPNHHPKNHSSKRRNEVLQTW